MLVIAAWTSRMFAAGFLGKYSQYRVFVTYNFICCTALVTLLPESSEFISEVVS